jgi:hypothetical protein
MVSLFVGGTVPDNDMDRGWTAMISMCKCGFFSNPESFSSIRESRVFVPQQNEIPKIVYSVTLSHNRTEITTYRILSSHVVIKARIGDDNLLVFFKSRTSSRLQADSLGTPNRVKIAMVEIMKITTCRVFANQHNSANRQSEMRRKILVFGTWLRSRPEPSHRISPRPCSSR